jgi:predicted NBD/HSP70 family sugar kinase
MVAREKFPTDMFYPTFVDELRNAIVKMVGSQEITACAIGLPGVINRESGVVESFGNLLWTDVHVRDDLSSVLSCPILLENDAKLAGLAEAYELSELYSRVLYVTVSTGIGLGLVVDGKIDYSVQDAGGKGLIMEHHGKLQAWEEFASGKAIVHQLGKMASEITDESDWYIVARNIAVGLIDLIVTLSPQCIVIGGGVGSHLPKFHEKLHEELEIYRSKMLSDMPQIVQAKHPEEAVVYGGYLLCKQQ